VSRPAHGRRLKSQAWRAAPSGKESGEASGGDDYIAAVHEADRLRQQEKAAATALVAFAQALAGTVLRPPVPDGGSRDAARQRTSLASPERGRRSAEPPRPDHRALVTFEEAMRVRWLGPQTAAQSGAVLVARPAKLRRPKDWRDPWPGGEFLIPSYAGEAEGS